MSANKAFKTSVFAALKRVIDATFDQIFAACRAADDGEIFVVPVLVLAAINHADGSLNATKTTFPRGQDMAAIAALLAHAHRTLTMSDLAEGETRQ